MAIELGVDRSYPWDPSIAYGQLKCLLCEQNLKTPFVKQLGEKGFCAGSRLSIDATVDNFSAGFTIDLISGPAEHSSVASGIPMRFQVSLTQMESYLSRKREGYWEVKDFTPPNAIFPFIQGDRFGIEFIHKNTYIEIIVNKKFYTLFKICPKDKISAIEISGKVDIQMLRVDNPLSTVVRETELPIVLSGPSTAICGYRSRSNKRTLLWPGSQIVINASLAQHAKRFQLTLQDGSVEQKTNCVVLQARFNLIGMALVLRSKSSQSNWMGNVQLSLANHSESLRNTSGKLEVIVECQLDYLRIALNGHHLCNYQHQLDFTRADHVIISGDIQTHVVRVT